MLQMAYQTLVESKRQFETELSLAVENRRMAARAADRIERDHCLWWAVVHYGKAIQSCQRAFRVCAVFMEVMRCLAVFAEGTHPQTGGAGQATT